jgi:hypothetical protein
LPKSTPALSDKARYEAGHIAPQSTSFHPHYTVSLASEAPAVMRGRDHPRDVPVLIPESCVLSDKTHRTKVGGGT